MADYTTLKTAVQIAIKANNNNEITGKILQQQLLAMINSLGSYYQLAGILGPSDTPKTDDQRVAYLAVEPGMYEHAGGFEVTELSLLMYDTAWEVHPLGVPFSSQIAAVIKALQDADKANAKAIADEKTSRTTAILAEQQAREQADTILQENIDKKQDTISDLTTIRTQAAHGQTAFSWGDHSKVGYITGITKAMVEDVLTGNITSHTHTFASLTDKPTTISGYGIRDAYTKAETDRKVVELQGLLDSMFERVYDSNNKLIRVHSNVTISSSGDLVAGGNSGGGGTSGGAYTQLEWNAIKALTQSESGLLASAYSVKEAYNELNAAIETLAGKATNVTFTQTLTSGKQIGTISIDGKSTSLFAPANYAWSEVSDRPTKLSQFTDDVVSGKYLPLSGGTMSNTNVVTNLNADLLDGYHASYFASAASLGNYLPLTGGTLTGGPSVFTPLAIKNTNISEVWIQFQDSMGTTYIGSTHGVPSVYLGSGSNQTLIHSGNYNSYAPTLTGTGATGTWGISISGNATTASYASVLLPISKPTTDTSEYGKPFSYFVGQPTIGTAEGNAYAGSSNDYNLLSFPPGGTTYNSEYANVMTLRLSWDKTKYWHDIFASPNYKFLWHRYVSSGTAMDWHRIVEEDNNTAWGINISGNADTLDGYHAQFGISNPWGTIPAISPTGYMDVGRSFEFHYDNTTDSDYSTILRCTGNYSNVIDLPSASGTLALLTDNVASATKLQNSRTIWGQSFDGTGNVSGNLTLDNNKALRCYDTEGNTHQVIKFTTSNFLAIGAGSAGASKDTYIYGNNIKFRYGADIETAMSITSSGNVGIGTTSPEYKLDVNGDIAIRRTGSSAEYFVINSNDVSVNYKGYDLSDGYVRHRFYSNDNLLLTLDGSNNIADFAGGVNITGAVIMSNTLSVAQSVTSGKFFTSGEYGLWKATSFGSGYTDNDIVLYAPTIGISGNVIPHSNSAHSLGTSSHKWSHLYAVGATFSGDVGIGTQNPSYKLHVVGTAYASQNIIAAGDLTAGSDIRYKDKIQDLRLSVHDIALAPAFTYKWNNREDALVHIGSSAQYWLNTDAKDAVYYDKQNDFYHLNYASLALCNTIILARGMETQEEKIARLEERIKELEDKLRQYDSNR